MNQLRKPLIGQALLRVEDERLLRGNGQYTDDIDCSTCLSGVTLRSPHAHAKILSIDCTAAQQLTGVQAVFTARDIEPLTTGPIPSLTGTPPWDIRNIDGNTLPDASMPVLAIDTVRFVGEAIAFVVADSHRIAEQAAELIDVAYKSLPALIDYHSNIADSAKPLWPDAPNNRSLNIERGDPETTDQAFAAATHHVQLTVDINRIAPVFMEPRSALGRFHDGRFYLNAGAQSAHGLKNGLAMVLGVEADHIHVTVPDMGGGFGARNSVYPEYLLVLLAARMLGHPVRWTASRSESFVSDAQSRDQSLHGELALDAEGNFLALRSTMHWRHGAYLLGRNAAVMASFFPPTNGGVYQFATSHVRMQGAFSNTTPQAAYRGIGRLESNYLIERLIDRAAQVLHKDPVSLRRQNLIQPQQLPWTTPTGSTYTSGEFAQNLERALLLVDHTNFEQRRRQSAAAGRWRGIGLGLYIENDGASPNEYANVLVDPDGQVSFGVGTQDFGMGHKTMFAQIAADALQLAFDDIHIFFGNTDKIPLGAGSAGSRSARLGGSAIIRCADTLLKSATEHASDLLETAAADIEYNNGRFTIIGTDRHLHLFEIASRLQDRGQSLAAEDEFKSAGDVHQNGCQICEVEVDPDTGQVIIANHVIVADVGRAVNPMIVDGQLHGGITQGLGQAGFENVVYDNTNGQVLSASLMDYCLPRATDLPFFKTELNEVVEADNPVGAKGAGEGPTSGAPAAFVNAVINALSPAGVQQLDMPLTPHCVWQAIKLAEKITS